MTGGVPALELRRAVWRCEHAGLSREAVRNEVLGEEHRRCTDEYDGLAGGLGRVRAHAPGLAREYEDAVRGAERALRVDEDLAAALGCLLRCRDLLARMRELLEADAALQRAAEPARRLWTAARVKRLRELPCVDVPGRLLAAAHDRMREGCYARAAYLAQASLRQSAAVMPDGVADPGRAAPLQREFDGMRQMCMATRGLLADPSADLLADGTLETAVALAGEGFVSLASRMAEELGAVLASRARFRRALDEDGAATVAALRERLSHLPDDERWEAATRILVHDRMAASLRRITTQPISMTGASR